MPKPSTGGTSLRLQEAEEAELRSVLSDYSKAISIVEKGAKTLAVGAAAMSKVHARATNGLLSRYRAALRMRTSDTVRMSADISSGLLRLAAEARKQLSAVRPDGLEEVQKAIDSIGAAAELLSEASSALAKNPSKKLPPSVGHVAVEASRSSMALTKNLRRWKALSSMAGASMEDEIGHPAAFE